MLTASDSSLNGSVFQAKYVTIDGSVGVGAAAGTITRIPAQTAFAKTRAGAR